MNPLKSYTISAGSTEVFNFEVMAPDADTALALAKADWSTTGFLRWTPCGPTDKPHLQVEGVRDVPSADIQAYDVTYSVTDRLHLQVFAASKDDALRIARALRDQNGTYEGDFEVVDSELSEIVAEEVRS